MAGFLVSRLFSAVIVVAGVCILVFLFIHLVPGDPVDVMLGEAALPADREALRHALGLDLSLPVQFWRYVSGLAHLDLGTSLRSHLPVAAILPPRIAATAELAGAGLAVAVIIAVPLGIVAALKRGSIWDMAAMGVSVMGISIPNFWFGPLLVLVFSVGLGWLPVSGREGALSIVLPALTLGTGLAAILSRMVRASLLEVLGEDYVRTAYAKGLRRRDVVLRHAMPNALLPVLTVLGLQLGALLGGTVITEVIFAWPGMGQLTVDAIQTRDYPVLQACVLLISLGYVVVNTLTDVLYAWFDPRIRLGDA